MLQLCSLLLILNRGNNMKVSFFNFMLKINNTSVRLYENEKDVGGMSCCDGITPSDVKNFMEWLFFNNKFVGTAHGGTIC
nr:MAG TPA: hypothetical protein [Caudoviricetes sp.]